jgi:hypothetical protein
MEFLILIWLLFGIVTAVVMNNKGRSSCAGFALGFLLGPFGLIIALVLSGNRAAQEREELQSGTHKRCPYCAELIRLEATKCRYCGSTLERPMDAELSGQLRFSTAELEVYRDEQLAALESVIAEGDASTQARVCETICRKIGRQHFAGPPREFLVAYYDQLKSRLDADSRGEGAIG